jgi:hypothetical protein
MTAAPAPASNSLSRSLISEHGLQDRSASPEAHTQGCYPGLSGKHEDPLCDRILRYWSIWLIALRKGSSEIRMRPR